MKRRIIGFIVNAIIGGMFISSTFAADVELKKIKIGGVVFNQYSYDLMEKGANYNAFEITRTYLSFSTNLTEKISFKAVTDIRRYTTSTPSNLQIFLKNMDFTIKDFFLGSNLGIGLINLPWVPFVEGIWKHRFVSTVFADTEGKLTSTDLAMQLSGKLIDKYLEYSFILANGEGYNNPEVNRAKDGYGRLTFTPMPDSLSGLRISAHYRAGLVNVEQKRDVANAIVSFEQSDYAIAAEYMYTVDQSGQNRGYYVGAGYSIFGFLKLPANFSLIGRYDFFDPDTNPDKTENGHFRVIYGIGYEIADGVKVAVDNQQVKYEANATGNNQSMVFAHMIIGF